ncbi:MAG: PilC/PilY family type IV pilus protein [Gammaproteobacteria bacterium]
MNFRPAFLIVLAAVITVIAGQVRADDTDIYSAGGVPLGAGSEPMVMFSLDYRPNLAATVCQNGECQFLIDEGYLPAKVSYNFFEVLRAVLRRVMDPLDGVKVGLMLNHAHENNCAGPDAAGCSNGGHIAMGFELFYDDDRNGAKEKFHKILESVPLPQGNQSHSYQGKELFFEFYRYLTGGEVHNAFNGWTDYSTDDSENLDKDNPGAAWDPTIEKNGDYTSPLDVAGECTRIFTVNPLFFVANQEDDSDDAIESPVANGGMGGARPGFADVIAYLQDADLGDGTYGDVPDIAGDQSVTSFFLVDPTKINRTTVGYAQAGGTGQPLKLSTDPRELVLTLEGVFRQILSVSTTFVAASVPINAFNRAEVTDNVYIALFQADEDARPSWVGNLKKLKIEGLESANTNARLVDALGNVAVAADGRIRSDALTFWTDPASLPPPDPDEGEVDGRDGRTVPRGGAGQKIPHDVADGPGLVNGFSGRTIYYDDGLVLSDLDATDVVANRLMADIGVATADEAEELLAYARGMDVDDIDGDNDDTDVRPWIFGDPLHSRPLPINYGARGGYSEQNPAIFIAVGSNDGHMRFVRNTAPGGGESGEEVWAFMPRSVMSQLPKMRDNIPGVSQAYTVDGAPVAYIEDVNQNGTVDDGEKAYLYFGLRRGGKAYYALDVSDPLSPRFLWKIEKGGDFAELGYTFSAPRIGRLDWGDGERPVLIFGGGYDMNKDRRDGVGTDDAEGTALYVVDAETGELVWKAISGGGARTEQVFEHPFLVDSVPSSVAVADTDGNRLTDRAVFGDTGGNVWRADFAGQDTIDWKLSLVARLGRHAGVAGKLNDRRFFHRPDIVQTRDGQGAFDAILIGSGDRADPLDRGGLTRNFFYMIKDRNIGAGAGVDSGLIHGQMTDLSDNCIQESGCSPDLSLGWRIQMERFGEKVLSTPLTIAGMVFFTSYIPQVDIINPCEPSEGSGRIYALNLQDAGAVRNYDTTDDTETGVPSTKEDRYETLKSPGIPAEVVALPPNRILRPDMQIENLDVSTRWRTFWYLEEGDGL